jgi:cysteine desulfurase
MKEIIYLDNAATTKVDPEVVKSMLPYFSEFYGNASSQHQKGFEAKEALEKSRRTIAKSINANPDEIIFMSSGTEANNFVLKGLFFSNPEKKHIITTKIEHDCILNTCKWLETKGVKVTYLDVDKEGFVNPQNIENAITKETLVVSIIHGNNEIGTIQDIETIGKICKYKGVYFHTDACQSYTKVPIDVKKQNLDLVTINSHKIHGPKGVGALYKKREIKITPLLHGGGHEFKLRSSTENIPGIVGFSKAVEIANQKDVKNMTLLRDRIIQETQNKIPNIKINGALGDKRLCNNINISFNNVEGEAIGGYLGAKNILTSTGSACSSNSLETSHVLKAIGLNEFEANSTIRISISKYTTDKEINILLDELEKTIKALRKISPIKN